jgi:hypothetical protein
VNPKLQKKVLTVQGPHGAHRQTFYVRPGEEHQLQFRKHSPVDVSESSATPKDRAEIHYGLFWSKTANKGIDHALESIGKVHAVPKNLLKIPIKVTGSLGGANGMYRYDEGRRERCINTDYTTRFLRPAEPSLHSTSGLFRDGGARARWS